MTSRSLTLVCGFLLAVVAALSFLPVLHHQFVDWDDYQCLTQNEHLRSLSAANLAWMATTGHMAQWQPLAWLMFALQYRFFGSGGEAAFSKGLHGVSLVLQVMVALVCFVVARRLLAGRTPQAGPGSPAPARSDRRALDRRRGAATGGRWLALNAAALAAALIYAVHPLRVEVVAWATGQPYLWALLLCLAAVGCYLRAVDSGQRRWLVASWIGYGLSLLFKPIAVPLVPVLLLLDWYPLRRWGGQGRRLTARGRGLLLEKIPPAILALASVVITPLVKEGGGSALPLSVHGLWPRLLQACYGLVFYPLKTILPIGLSPLYELRLPLVPWQAKYLVPLAVVLLVGVGALLLRRRSPATLVAVTSYALLVFPVLGFFQSGNQEVADRYGALPAVPLMLLVGAGLLRLWSPVAGARSNGRGTVRPGGRVLTAVTAVLVTLAVGGLAAATRQQCLIWRDSAALWTRAVARQSDSSLAQNGYGYVLLERGRAAEAIEHFRQAIRIKPRNDVAHRNLWRALQELGRTPELIAAYREALRIFPEKWELYRSLGNAYFRQKQYTDAVDAYRQALAASPRDAATLASLAGAHYALGDRRQASASARRALDADPGNQLARRILELVGSGSGEPEVPTDPRPGSVSRKAQPDSLRRP